MKSLLVISILTTLFACLSSCNSLPINEQNQGQQIDGKQTIIDALTMSSRGNTSSSSGQSVSSQPVPGKIEAESYNSMSGVQTEACSEGTLNVGWIDTGDWMDYYVSVTSSGTYRLEYRVANQYDGGKIDFLCDNSTLATTTVPNTGGWQTWTTVKTTVNLTAGLHKIRLSASGSPWNLNFFTLTKVNSSSSPSILPVQHTQTVGYYGNALHFSLTTAQTVNNVKIYLTGYCIGSTYISVNKTNTVTANTDETSFTYNLALPERPTSIIFKYNFIADYQGTTYVTPVKDYFMYIDYPSSSSTGITSSSSSSSSIVSSSSSSSSQPGGLKVQFYNGSTAVTGNQIYGRFNLVNTGTAAISLDTVKIHYYYTSEGAQNQSFWCDWSPVGSVNVTGIFKSGANNCLEIGFTGAADSLAPGASIDLQTRIAKSDWSNYNQADDYSFNPTGTSFSDWSKVTAYLEGILVWGIEP